MKNSLTFLIGIVLALVLLTYMFTYQVAYDEVAVLTTFDNAEQPVILTSSVVAAAPPATAGVGAADAVFTLAINGGEPVDVVVPAAALADNAQAEQPLEAARQDVAAALATAGLGDRVEAGLVRSRLVLSVGDADAELAVLEANPAARQALGLTRHVADPGSLKYDAGLKIKAPWPIQKVYKYSQKIHLLEAQLEEIQTADKYAVIVKTYVAWSINDPYAFFRSLRSPAAADEQLAQMARNLNAVIGSYEFGSLVNTNPDALKLREIEEACAVKLREQLADTDFGIEIKQVGIRRILLPEATTQDVFDRMVATRERLAESILATGEARARTIESEANYASSTILSFAQRRAEAIRAEGDRSAAAQFDAFREDQELAIFLRQIEALKQMLAHRTTFILDAHNQSILEPFVNPPGGAPAAAPKAADVKADQPAPAQAARQ